MEAKNAGQRDRRMRLQVITRSSQCARANENIDRRYDLSGLEEVGHHALDSWEKRISAKGRDGHRWFALPRNAE